MKKGKFSGVPNSTGSIIHQSPRVDTDLVNNRSYNPFTEYTKEQVKGWLDLKTFFKQKKYILRNPTIMITYPEGTDNDFKSPLKFSIQCVGFYLLVSYAVTTPLTFFVKPMDIANSGTITWILSTSAKAEALIIPITIIVSSSIFSYVIFKTPANRAIMHGNIIHMTYIQSILFCQTPL